MVLPCCLQSVETVKKMLEEGRKPHGVMFGGGIETDEYIDDAMDNELDYE